MIPWFQSELIPILAARTKTKREFGSKRMCANNSFVVGNEKKICGQRWNWKLRFLKLSHIELIRYIANIGDSCHNLKDACWSYHFAVCLISGNFNFIVNKLGVRPTIENKCSNCFASIRCIFFSKNILSVNNNNSCVSRLVRKFSVLPYAFDNLGQTNLNLPLECGFPSTDATNHE